VHTENWEGKAVENGRGASKSEKQNRYLMRERWEVSAGLRLFKKRLVCRAKVVESANGKAGRVTRYQGAGGSRRIYAFASG